MGELRGNCSTCIEKLYLDFKGSKFSSGSFPIKDCQTNLPVFLSFMSLPFFFSSRKELTKYKSLGKNPNLQTRGVLGPESDL